MNRKTGLTAAILSACVVAGAARAETFVFAFSAKDGAGHGAIVANQLSPGIFAPASIEGVANGSPIVALGGPLDDIARPADPKQPPAFLSITFATADGSIFYLTSRGGSYLLSVLVGPTDDFLTDEPAEASVSVPEIPTWAMLPVAFAGAGLISRRRRAKSSGRLSTPRP